MPGWPEDTTLWGDFFLLPGSLPGDKTPLHSPPPQSLHSHPLKAWLSRAWDWEARGQPWLACLAVLHGLLYKSPLPFPSLPPPAQQLCPSLNFCFGDFPLYPWGPTLSTPSANVKRHQEVLGLRSLQKEDVTDKDSFGLRADLSD